MLTRDVHEVDGSGGLTGDVLRTAYAYDDAGRQVRTISASGVIQKQAYDARGRVSRSVVIASEGTETDPTTFTDDVVLTETEQVYDDAGQVLSVTTYDRAPDATVTGLLSAASASASRVTYAAAWYDDAGRATHQATYGDHGGSAFSRPGTPPEPDSSDVTVPRTASSISVAWSACCMHAHALL